MTAVLNWIVPIAVVLILGAGATYYIRTVQMRRDETAAGISALSAMSWRDFIHLVLETLARRGYVHVVDRQAPGDDGEYTLQRSGRRWLMSCKHGSAFVLGTAAVNELANDIKLRSAAGGLLVTQGRIADEARGPAKLQQIELLDGPTLWPEMRDLIPPQKLEAIHAGAMQRARQNTLLAWLTALLIGIVMFFAMPRPADAPAQPATAAPPAVPAVPAASTASTAPAAPATPAAPAPAVAPPAAGNDAATLQTQREDIANAISTLPMVDRAIWTSSSNLQVYLLDSDGDAFAAICPLMERYPDLASSRVQLTPPPGSQAQVRFRQCRSY